MTYAAWGSADRLPGRAEEFARLERDFLDGNPWLRDQFDFGRFAGRRVLDLGCGSGVAACLLARRGAAVAAADLTRAAATLARRNALGRGLAVGVARMDAERMGLRTAALDFVFAWGALHHTPDTEAALLEVARILRPGGEGLVMVYNRRSLRYWLKGLWWLLGRGRLFRGDTLATVQRFFTDGYYHRHFTAGELRAALRAAGLRPTRVVVTHMGKRYVPVLPGPADAWLKRKVGWLLVAEFRRGA
jgi:SAM-dependent methyltransferase